VITLRTESGIVASWLAKIVIGIAIFGVIAYDAGSILVNYFTLDSGADDLAIAMSLDITRSNANQFTDSEVFDLAKEIVADPDEGVEGAKVVRNGTHIDDQGVIHVKLRRSADTLIVERIGAIEDWAKATSEGTSIPTFTIHNTI
jgi:hypothetical protein